MRFVLGVGTIVVLVIIIHFIVTFHGRAHDFARNASIIVVVSFRIEAAAAVVPQATQNDPLDRGGRERSVQQDGILVGGPLLSIPGAPQSGPVPKRSLLILCVQPNLLHVEGVAKVRSDLGKGACGLRIGQQLAH
jgi:hypothetical protein